MERQEIIEELRRLVKSRNNDAVKLAWMDGGDLNRLARLDLRGVTELKRTEKGGFEVKFVDRLKALELLERLCSAGDDSALEEFLNGLEGTP